MATTRASILLADDDPAVLQALSMAFKLAGHAVTPAADGTKAIEALDRGPYDLMVLDILMPGATGWEVLESALSRTPAGAPTPRALLITGFNSEYVVDMSVLRREGVAGMLLKPFPAQDILDEVQRALALPVVPAPARSAEGSVRF